MLKFSLFILAVLGSNSCDSFRQKSQKDNGTGNAERASGDIVVPAENVVSDEVKKLEIQYPTEVAALRAAGKDDQYIFIWGQARPKYKALIPTLQEGEDSTISFNTPPE